MPLALLLQKTFQDMGNGIRDLEPWNQLVAMELVLLDRVRSAFLVHWFGPHLPLHGQHLRIAIANLDALRDRYQAVRRASQPEPAGLNLTEPLAGFAGQIVGAALSPAGVLLIGTAAVLRIHSWIGKLGGALLTIVATGVIPAVAGGLGLLALPFAFIGALLLGAFNQEQARGVYDLLGGLAELMEAIRRFVEQLLGPREGVRNPLIRAFLEIMDKLAAVIPFVMALLAIVFSRIGALLLPLAAQVTALRALAEAVIATVAFIFEDFVMRLSGLFTDTSPTQELEEGLGALSDVTPGPMGLVFGLLQRVVGGIGDLFKRNPSPLTILLGALHAVQGIPAVLLRGLMAVMGNLGAELTRIGTAMRLLVDAWLPAVTTAVRAAILDHPTAQALIAGREIMGILIPAFRSTAPSAPAASSGSGGSSLPSIPFFTPPPFPKFQSPNAAAIAGRSGPAPLLDLNQANVQDVAGLIEAQLRGPVVFRGRTILPFSYSSETLESIKHIEQPRSVFTAGRLALRDARGRTPAEQLAAAHAQEAPLRDALLAVVGRVFPQAVAAYMPRLTDLFNTLEQRLYPADSALEAHPPAPDLPVLRVPESDRLQPVVHRLRIVSAGTDQSEADSWGDTLRQTLLAQSYTVAAAGGV